ncbi:hypothetical protein B0H13DRAFT_2521002 [Mycena leptocephala]|nr:hypothetical protein B0H13DRAFT_2521002 [Mycena leptocephala]
MSNTKSHVPNALDAHLQDVVVAFGVTGTVLTALLLFAIAYAAWKPVLRHHLDRVSFRLLVCALISNLLCAANSIPVFSGPSVGCSFMAFFALGILMFSACMFFCIALNLQLVLVHHVNGNSMERFYYIGSVAAVLVLHIAPYAAGQFGYYNGICWFSDPRPDVHFRWLLGSQVVWILLISTGEVIRREGVLTSSDVIPKPPIVAYRSIILRIGLYPLLSCCLNFTGSILDIWLSKNPVPTELQWRLSLVDLCVFTLRPILYTLLAAADPGFLRAMRGLRNHGKSTHSTGSTSSMRFPNSHRMNRFSMNGCALVHVQLEQKNLTGEAGGKKSRLEQDSAALKPFEQQNEPEQSGSSQVEQEWEREEELDVEVQTRSRAEDIVRQI